MSCIERRRVLVRGAVQGVGFRPFAFRLAHELDLKGWVSNTSSGVAVDVEGEPEGIRRFLQRMGNEAPPRAHIQGMESSVLDPCGYTEFVIRESNGTGPPSAFVLPDIAMCDGCRREILDPANRRYRYPFTNCTHCGPRYTIIRALPYDRATTTMASFTMCAACLREYEDPEDRRFHAQPNACPDCGPQLAWWDEMGRMEAFGQDALRSAVRALYQGQIVAVMGVGGFHLMTDARDPACLMRLRQRKHRAAKPFAVMYPDLKAVLRDCEVSPEEARLLLSPEAPIVLLRKRKDPAVCDLVAPDNPNLGVLLPYSPLHEILIGKLEFPLVATSANLSEEPICIDGCEAVERLQEIADAFLVHDRPIRRPVDDSVARVVLGRDQILRRARGYAPLPFAMPMDVDRLLAVGGHLKNTVAIGVGRNLFVSQHIGDLETVSAHEAFLRTVDDLQAMYAVKPDRVASDLHPDYQSTRFAQTLGVPVQAVQHHFAHVAAVMVDNEIAPPVHGVAWDGTGYGTDGTVWGGEFVMVDAEGVFQRSGHLLPFMLPGGEAAIREPRRSAMGLLAAAGIDGAKTATRKSFTENEWEILKDMLANETGVVATTSMGRLFDGVASLLGLCHVNRFEGEGAMAVEYAAKRVEDAYPFAWKDPHVLDWRPLLRSVMEDLDSGVAAGTIAGTFHAALAEIIVSYAQRVGAERMVLSGGCFQNRLLTELAVAKLESADIRAYWPQRIPPNDGGICVGQAALATGWKKQE